MTLQELYAESNRWTQGAMARCKDDHPRDTWETEAVCYCLLGGIESCYDEPEQQVVIDKLFDILIERGVSPAYEMAKHGCKTRTLINWNDHPSRQVTEIQQLVKEANV